MTFYIAFDNAKSSHQGNRGPKGPGQCTFCTSVQHCYFRRSCFLPFFSHVMHVRHLHIIRPNPAPSSTPEHKVAKIKAKTNAKAKARKKEKDLKQKEQRPR